MAKRAVPPRRSAERRRGVGPRRVLLRREVSWVVEHRSRSRGSVGSGLDRESWSRRCAGGGRGDRRRGIVGRTLPSGPAEIPAAEGWGPPRRAAGRETWCSPGRRRKAWLGEGSRRRSTWYLSGRQRSVERIRGAQAPDPSASRLPSLTRGGGSRAGDPGVRGRRQSSRGDGGARGLRMSIRSKVSWVIGPIFLTGKRIPIILASRVNGDSSRDGEPSSPPGGTGGGCLRCDTGHPAQGVADSRPRARRVSGEQPHPPPPRTARTSRGRKRRQADHEMRPRSS